MEKLTEPAKCKKCTAPILQHKAKHQREQRKGNSESQFEEEDEHVLCMLCRDALYCSDKCQTADLYVNTCSDFGVATC